MGNTAVNVLGVYIFHKAWVFSGYSLPLRSVFPLTNNHSRLAQILIEFINDLALRNYTCHIA